MTALVRNLATYVLRGQKQAVIVALAFTFLPLLSWVADVVLAFVTLRKGAKEGGILLLWVVLPSIVFAILSYPQLWIYNVVGGSLVTYLLAVILRQTNGWAIVLQAAMILGIVGVAIVYLVIPDIGAMWVKQLTSYVLVLKQQFNLDMSATQLQQNVQLFSKIATGVQAALILIGDIVNLFFARWVQSTMYNPGQLKPELFNIRLGTIAASLLAVTALAAISGVDFAIDCLPVVVLPYVFAGLSLLHNIAAIIKKPKAWLAGFYGLWILFFPYVTILLVGLVLADGWLDFRKKLQNKFS